MEARFKWNDDAMSNDQAASPRRHGDAAGRRASCTDGWDWREGGERTLFCGGVRSWRSDPHPSVTVTAWEVGAIRSLVAACEVSVRSWQSLLEGAEEQSTRDRCVSHVRWLDEAPIELAAISEEAWESGAGYRAAKRRRASAEWRPTETRGWLELLGNAALHQSALCERYASALAGSQSEHLRELLNAQATRAELGLNEIRALISGTQTAGRNTIEASGVS